MLNLAKVKLPDTVSVLGSDYKIKTEFHWWIRFSQLLKNKEIKKYTDCDFLYADKKPENRVLGFSELTKFLRPERTLPRATGKQSDRIIVDFDEDANLIYCAFLEQYGIDLLDEKTHLHWWKFNALFDGLHGTKLNEIMGYRSFDENDKTSERQTLIELREAWSIDVPLSDAEQEALDAFNAQFELGEIL